METNNGSNKFLTKLYIYNEDWLRHVKSYKTVAVIST